MRRLVENAVRLTDAFGSTVFCAATLLGTKVTYCHLGDVQLLILRYNDAVRQFETVHATSPLYMDTLINGVRAPRQVTVYHKEHRTPAAVRDIMSHAVFGAVEVEHNDMVIVYSDGVGDNVTIDSIRGYVNNQRRPWAYRPQDVAEGIMQHVCDMRHRWVKPDDMSVFVGKVCRWS